MSTIDEIQTGIKRVLDTVPDLRAHATEPDQPNLPCAYPRLVQWTYDTDFDGGQTYLFDVWVVVDMKQGLNRAQTALNAFLSRDGRKSLKVAIERDMTLSGTVDSARVVGGGAYGQAEIAGMKALAASVRLEAIT